MPRLRLDPTAPNGISIAPDDMTPAQMRRAQGNGYVSNKATGLIKAGTNVTLTGTGTTSDPYTISSSGGSGGTNATNLTESSTSTSITIASDTGTDATIASASSTKAGVLTASDKSKLDSLATVATSGSYTDLSDTPTIPTDLTDLGDVSISTPSNGQVLKYNGTSWVNGTDATGSGGTTLPADATGWLHDDGSGTLTWSTPSKSDVGLGNVDNTSDATKNSATATLTNKDLTSATNTFPTFNQNTTGTASNVTGTVTVGHGGTGATSLTGIIKGNGTSAFTAVTAPSGTIVGTTDSQTLTNKTITNPKISQINDSNGNKVATFTGNSSAVNYVDIENAAATFAPAVIAAGTDTNLNLFLRGKGTGSTIMADGGGNAAFVGQGNGGTPVNYLTATNADTANAPKLSALGSDTNIDIEVDPKGNGSLFVNSSNGVKLLGSTSTPTTPSAGKGLLYASGTTHAAPTWINETGSAERIITTTGPTYISIASNFSTSSTSQTAITGLTGSITVPSGRAVKISGCGPYFYNNGANYSEIGIWRGSVGTGTQIGWYGSNGTNPRGWSIFTVDNPSAGSVTYSFGCSVTGGTATVEASSVRPAWILLELI